MPNLSLQSFHCHWPTSAFFVGAAASLWSGCQHAPSVSADAPSAKASVVAASKPASPESPAVSAFHKVVGPILKERCYECHGDGASKGGIAFDELTADRIGADPQLWLKVLRNTRSHIMPPLTANNPLADSERIALESWIKTSAFGLDPSQLDPGRVTVHRLNRVEYKNTVRDLMGVEFETKAAFPDDDSGYGFDNIADVLNMSPLLMEKYLAAAQAVVSKAVPTVTQVPAQQIADVADFNYADGKPTVGKIIRGSGLGADGIPAIGLPFPIESSISHEYKITKTGDYRLVFEQNIRGDFIYNPQRAQITVTVDGAQVSRKEFSWESNHDIDDSYSVHWSPAPTRFPSRSSQCCQSRRKARRRTISTI